MASTRRLHAACRALIGLSASAVWVTAPHTTSAQTPVPAAAQQERPASDGDVAELRKVLLEQQQLLLQQQTMIEAQGRAIEALNRRLDSVARPTGEGSPPAAPPGEPSAAVASAAAQEGEQVAAKPELQVVAAGEFPRSISVPGTTAAFRIGGQARFTMVHSYGPLGTDDRFVTSSIPVGEAQEAGTAGRVNYSAAASRANVDLRTRSGKDGTRQVRFFVESDFAGDARTLRLRHAFIQSGNWLGGQTWSTFSDPEAEPAGLDFEGLNAISLFRQPQIRYTRAVRSNIDMALALENPAPDLTGATGVNMTPDFVARMRWHPIAPQLLGKAQYTQVAMLVRTLRGEVTTRPDETLSTGGFGVNFSGVFAPYWDADDRIKFAANAGWGIGRYITDLGTLGGQDAVYDGLTDTLRALHVSAWYLGYERAWTSAFASTVTYGLVNVSNLDVQPGDQLHRTHRTSVNFTWSPVPEASLVLEFLGGTRLNKNGQSATSTQMQAGWLFRF